MFAYNKSAGAPDNKADKEERHRCLSSSSVAPTSEDQQGPASSKQSGQPSAYDRIWHGEERDASDLSGSVTKAAIDYSEEVRGSKISECR